MRPCLLALLFLSGCVEAHVLDAGQTSADAGHDAGTDAAASDGGSAETDAGSVAGTDAGSDAGSDAGTRTCTADDALVFGAPSAFAGGQRWVTSMSGSATESVSGPDRAMTQVLITADGARMLGALGGPCHDDDAGFGWFAVLERVRGTGGAWTAPSVHCVNADNHPWLVGTTGLLTHHGCGLHGLFRTRTDAAAFFPIEHTAGFYTGEPVSGADLFGPDDGVVAASHFTLTPDGALLAFASNRRSAADPGTEALPSGGCPGGGRELYLAQANEAGNPLAGFTSIMAAEASPAGAISHPMWFSDDALRLLFVSDRDGTLDVFLATRTSSTVAFGAPVKVTELSSAFTERTVTLPSLATIVASGCRSDGYLVRAESASSHVLYEFPVCLGAGPCD